MDQPGREAPARPFTVCLLGASFETENRGVSALAASLVDLFAWARPEARIVLLSDNRTPTTRTVPAGGGEVTVELANCRLSPGARLCEHIFWIALMACAYRLLPAEALRRRIARRCPWIAALRSADFVGDIWGGDSFSDIYGTRRFLLGALQRAVALLVRGELVLLPQTYGPFRSRLSRAIARAILRRASCILSRDRRGIAAVSGLLGAADPPARVRFCPDVAFVMRAEEPPLGDLPPARRPVLGINVSGLLAGGGYTRANMFGLGFDYTRFVDLLLSRALERTPGSVILIPHTYGPEGDVESDPAACRSAAEAVPARHRARVHVIDRPYDQFQLKGIIGRCDAFIGSRMHACIAAISQGVPTIGVAYSPKFQGVFEAVGLGDMVIDARSADMESACARALSLLEGSGPGRRETAETAREAARQVRDAFAELLCIRPAACSAPAGERLP